MPFSVRRFGPADRTAVAALEGAAYRPEDRPAVDAMRRRAARARRLGDSLLPTGGDAGDGEPFDRYADRWVVTADESAGREPPLPRVVGAVAARWYGDSSTVANDSAEASGLFGDGIATVELRHLRVAPAMRRRGIGATLVRHVTSWAADSGAGRVVLNTTAAQAPAIALYRRLGFLEVGRVHLGEYELVWMSLAGQASKLPG